MTMHTPGPGTTSVVIPAYNRAHVIGRAIGSALAQTRPPDEVVVVDDCSKDATREALTGWARREPRVRPVLLARNAGPAGARNAGVAATRGRFVAFLDSDDVWLPDHLRECVGLLEADPGLDVAFSDLRRVRTSGEVLHAAFLSGHKRIGRHLVPHPAGRSWFRFHRPEAEALFRDALVPVQTSVVRAEVARAFPFDADLRGPEDYHLMLRLARAGKRFGYVDRVLGECLLHDTNLVGDGADLRMCGEDIKLWSGVRGEPGLGRRERAHCDRHLARLQHDRGYGLLCRGEPAPALRAYAQSLWHRPTLRAARGLVKAGVGCLTGRKAGGAP